MKITGKGRSCPLFSDIDFAIFQKVLEEKEVNKTAFDCRSYQYVSRRLIHWKNKGLLDFKEVGKSKVKIIKGKDGIIRSQIDFFKEK